jgi:hypothetical protein
MLTLSGSVLRACSLPSSAGRGLPGGNSRSFASSKESKQRKGDPAVCVPSLRCGQPVVLGPAGVKNNSPAAQTSFCPDPSGPPLLGAYRRGWETEYQTAKDKNPSIRRNKDTPWRVLVGIGFGFLFGLPRPGWAEERRGKRIRDRDCLSEVQRSEFERDPACLEHRRLPRSAAQGTQTAGRLSFGDFSLAKQRKVTCRRAPPGQQASAKSTTPEQAPTGLQAGQQEQQC